MYKTLKDIIAAMKVSSLNPKLNTNYQNKSNTSFKKGLPSWFIGYSKEVNPYKIESELARKGIDASFKGESVVAACCQKVVEIMECYGFELPKRFSFEPLNRGILGSYTPYSDKVAINSIYNQFRNVVKQNQLEESQIGYHPISGHFLQTYLHEFSHAAHFHNLCNELGESEANRVFWGYLSDHSPRNIIVGPLNTIVKSLISNKWLLKLVEKAIPPTNGVYAKTDLTEYMAEKNARLIAEDLNSSLNPRYNADIPFGHSPYGWSFSNAISDDMRDQVNPTIITEAIRNSVEYLDRDIWNGEIENLESNRNTFYIK